MKKNIKQLTNEQIQPYIKHLNLEIYYPLFIPLFMKSTHEYNYLTSLRLKNVYIPHDKNHDIHNHVHFPYLKSLKMSNVSICSHILYQWKCPRLEILDTPYIQYNTSIFETNWSNDQICKKNDCDWMCKHYINWMKHMKMLKYISLPSKIIAHKSKQIQIKSYHMNHKQRQEYYTHIFVSLYDEMKQNHPKLKQCIFPFLSVSRIRVNKQCHKLYEFLKHFLYKNHKSIPQNIRHHSQLISNIHEKWSNIRPYINIKKSNSIYLLDMIFTSLSLCMNIKEKNHITDNYLKYSRRITYYVNKFLSNDYPSYNIFKPDYPHPTYHYTYTSNHLSEIFMQEDSNSLQQFIEHVFLIIAIRILSKIVVKNPPYQFNKFTKQNSANHFLDTYCTSLSKSEKEFIIYVSLHKNNHNKFKRKLRRKINDYHKIFTNITTLTYDNNIYSEYYVDQFFECMNKLYQSMSQKYKMLVCTHYKIQ